MGWVGPNGRVYKDRRWVVFAAIGAAFVAVAGWVKGRMTRKTDDGAEE
jgi:hypothetical protein